MCDDKVTPAETNSLNNIHRWITLNTWTFTLMSVFLSACFIPICCIHQIWYPKLSVIMFISRPYFKPHVISFRDICGTTTFTSTETNSLRTFIYESHIHIHVFISESMLYTNLLVHSTRLDTQRFPLLCIFQDLALNHMPFHLEVFVWRQSYFSRDQQPQEHSYMNHITYVNIHIHVCLSECMLYTH